MTDLTELASREVPFLLPSPLRGPRRAKLALEVGGGGPQALCSQLTPLPNPPPQGGREKN
jgi:hypothetical protein